MTKLEHTILKEKNQENKIKDITSVTDHTIESCFSIHNQVTWFSETKNGGMALAGYSTPHTDPHLPSIIN